MAYVANDGTNAVTNQRHHHHWTYDLERDLCRCDCGEQHERRYCAAGHPTEPTFEPT